MCIRDSKKTAYLIEKGVSGDRLCEVIAQAQEARKDGSQVLVARMNKNLSLILISVRGMYVL